MKGSRTAQETRRRCRWALHPAMGFRLSPFDVALLASGGLLAWILWKPLGQAALLPMIVLGHFFLFCNVFRIDRRLELTWAAAFILNLAAWSFFSGVNWSWILAIQTPLTVGLILYEVRCPRYHGIGSAHLRSRRAKAEEPDHEKEAPWFQTASKSACMLVTSAPCRPM